MFFAAVVLLAIGYALLVGYQSEIYVSGTVKIAPHLRDKSAMTRTVFIILRKARAGLEPHHPAMPWGAYRDQVDFSNDDEYSFVLTKDNLQLMAQQQSPPEHFDIKVRLDRDGQGGMDQPGDLVGKLQQVELGSRAIDITIDTEVTP